jgi:hypothetical protein
MEAIIASEQMEGIVLSGSGTSNGTGMSGGPDTGTGGGTSTSRPRRAGERG